MAEPRPGAALAAALQQTAHQLAEEQTMASHKVVAAGPGASHASHAAHAQFAAQLRRLEQQIELEHRQVERRLDKMERRIEEVASLSTSSGRWAELQGHVDGLEESLQNLIRGRSELAPVVSNGANGCNGQVPHGGSPASWGRVSELDDQVLQISHRLLRLEHSLQGDSGDIERPQPQEMLKFKGEVQEGIWSDPLRERQPMPPASATDEMQAAPAAIPVPPPDSGSRGHPVLCRRPCIRFAKGSCNMGHACGYCHYEHDHRATLDRRQRLLLNNMDTSELLAVLLPHVRHSLEVAQIESSSDIIVMLEGKVGSTKAPNVDNFLL
eukprot:s4340_g1.t2